MRVFRKSKWLNKINAIQLQSQFSYSLFRKAVELNGDIYHCNDLWTLQAGKIAADGADSILIYDSHEIEIHRNTPLWSKIQKKAWERYEKRYIKYADKIITVSDGCAGHISANYKLDNVSVVRNIPEKTNFKPGVTVRDTLQLDRTIPLIIYVGSVTYGRGLDIIFDSLIHLKGFTFCTIGPVNNSFKPILKEMIATKGLSERVFFVDPVPATELVRFIKDADLSLSLIQNVCLSYYHSLPNKVFESINAFVPLVCSDFPDMSTIVKKYSAGELCVPDEPASVAKCIRSVYENKSKFYQPEKIKQIIKKELNFEEEGKRLLKIYKGIH
jgi:glycosyltransferase involved in cell wall biosynthesis